MNIKFSNTAAAPAPIDFTPPWAARLIDLAHLKKEKTISLGNVPSKWFEHIAFNAKKLVYQGQFIEVTVEEFSAIVKGGLPC